MATSLASGLANAQYKANEIAYELSSIGIDTTLEDIQVRCVGCTFVMLKLWQLTTSLDFVYAAMVIPIFKQESGGSRILLNS